MQNEFPSWGWARENYGLVGYLIGAASFVGWFIVAAIRWFDKVTNTPPISPIAAAQPTVMDMLRVIHEENREHMAQARKTAESVVRLETKMDGQQQDIRELREENTSLRENQAVIMTHWGLHRRS